MFSYYQTFNTYNKSVVIVAPFKNIGNLLFNLVSHLSSFQNMNEQTGEKTSKKETKHIGALVSVHRYRFTPGAFS